MATGDYGGFYGLHGQLVDANPALEPSRRAKGLLYKVDDGTGSKIKFASVSDGLSNTIYVTESGGRPQVYRKGVPFGSPNTAMVNGGGWCRPASELGEYRSTTQDGISTPGTCALNCTNGISMASTDYVAPAGVTAHGGTPSFGTDGTGQPYSFHTGGANTLMGDGSVRFIQASISVVNFAGLVTRDGGEVNVE